MGQDTTRRDRQRDKVGTMNYKALADMILERDNALDQCGTSGEKVCPDEPSKKQAFVPTISGDISTVERCKTPVHSEPISSPAEPVRQSIAALVEYAVRIGRGEIGSHIETHPAQWGTFAFEYSGMIDQHSETRPDADQALVRDLAVEAVCLWTELDYLRRIDGDTYRAKMHGPGGVWDSLRLGVKA